jgi:hypothetical protein
MGCVVGLVAIVIIVFRDVTAGYSSTAIERMRVEVRSVTSRFAADKSRAANQGSLDLHREPAPGKSHGCENKGVAAEAVCMCLKTKDASHALSPLSDMRAMIPLDLAEVMCRISPNVRTNARN